MYWKPSQSFSSVILKNSVKLSWLEPFDNNSHVAKVKRMIIDKILLFLYLLCLLLSSSSSGISTLTHRRNSFDAPIKRRRVETRKRSDVSQIAFLAPLNAPDLSLSDFAAPLFFTRSRGSPRQEFSWMIYLKSEFSVVRVRTLRQNFENLRLKQNSRFLFTRSEAKCALLLCNLISFLVEEGVGSIYT